MKRLYVVVGILVVAVLAIGGVLLLQGNSNADGNCNGVHSESHMVMIMDSKVDNDHISGKLCDTMTITNMDNVSREIAFGPHEDHVPYDGVAERVLNKGQSLTITFNKTGSYHWHDHIHDEVEGFFTVTN